MSALSDLSSYEILERIGSKHIIGKDLTIDIRQRLVDILRHSKTQAEIAHILGVCERTVERDVNAIRKKSVVLAKDITVDTVAGDMVALARRLQAAAWKAKNHNLVWKIETDLVDNLQALGCVHKAKQELKVDMVHTFKDKDDKEIDDLFRQCLEDEERNRDFAQDREGSPSSN